MATLTTTKGNPAYALRQQYERLMTITDTGEFKEAVKAVLTTGISHKNKAKVLAVLAKEESLLRLRSYITNFLLAADGLAVL